MTNTATQELLDMTSALDPRFKLKYVSEDNRGSIEDRLTAEMKSVMTAMVIIIINYNNENLSGLMC